VALVTCQKSWQDRPLWAATGKRLADSHHQCYTRGGVVKASPGTKASLHKALSPILVLILLAVFVPSQLGATTPPLPPDKGTAIEVEAAALRDGAPTCQQAR